MADTFDWSVIIRLAAQGAKGVTDDVKQVSGALSTLQREGKVTEKVYDQTSKSLSKMGDAGRKASSDLASFSSPSLRYALYDVASPVHHYSSGKEPPGPLRWCGRGRQLGLLNHTCR